MIKNRYQYIFAIALLIIIHVSIMYFWVGNMQPPANLNASNTANKSQKNNQVQANPSKFTFTNY